MKRLNRRLLVPLLAVTAAASLATSTLLPVQAEAAPQLTLGQTVLGNVFVDDRTASFQVNAVEAPQIRWTVLDERSAILTQGAQRTSVPTLDLPELPLGFYRLKVEGISGTKIVTTTETTFALIEDFEGARDDRFSINPKFGLPEVAPTWDPDTDSWADEGIPLMSTDIMPLLSQTGVHSVRENLPWNNLEVEENQFIAGPSWYQGYLDAVNEAGIKPNILLTYGNKFHDADAEGFGAFPHTPEGRAAFAEYARQVVTRPGSDIDLIEVWNEGNSDAPWNRGPCTKNPDGSPTGPDVRAGCYYELLKVVYPVVKEAKPDAMVTGPAGVTIPYPYLEELFKRGGLQYLDAVTVHPYMFPQPPETGFCTTPGNCGLEARITQLRDLIRKYNNGQDKPIRFSEIGWGSYTGDVRGVTEQQQADYMVRTHAIAFANGVDHIDWYSVQDAKVLPEGPGANWGLLRHPDDPLGRYVPKESYTAYTTMTRQLSGKPYQGSDPTPAGTRSVQFAESARSERTRVMWASAEPRTVTLLTRGRVTVTGMDGTPLQQVTNARTLTLTLTQDPVYVTGEVLRVTAP